MTKNASRAPLLAAAMLIAASPAAAVTSSEFEYDATQVGYFTIQPMALAPVGDASASDYFVYYFDGKLTTSTNDTCFNTGINLPQGSLLASVQVWFSSSPGYDPRVMIFRTHLATGNTEQVVDTVFADDTTFRTSGTATVSGPLRLIKNGTYAYGFGVCLGQGTTFEGARLRYTYDNAGD